MDNFKSHLDNPVWEMTNIENYIKNDIEITERLYSKLYPQVRRNIMRDFIGRLGHRVADFDTQSGLTGKFVRLCWRIGYGK